MDFSDDSSGATYNSVLGSSEEDEVDEGGEVREGGREREREKRDGRCMYVYMVLVLTGRIFVVIVMCSVRRCG